MSEAPQPEAKEKAAEAPAQELIDRKWALRNLQGGPMVSSTRDLSVLNLKWETDLPQGNPKNLAI